MIKSCGWLVYLPTPQKRKKTKPPTRYDWKLLKTTLLRALVVQLFVHMMYWLYTGMIQKNEILYDTGDNEKYSSGYEVWRVSGRLFISHQQIRMGGGLCPYRGLSNSMSNPGICIFCPALLKQLFQADGYGEGTWHAEDLLFPLMICCGIVSV